MPHTQAAGLVRFYGPRSSDCIPVVVFVVAIVLVVVAGYVASLIQLRSRP